MESVGRMRMPVLSLPPTFCAFRTNCRPTSQHREHCEKKMVFFIAVMSLLSLPFSQSKFTNSLHFLLLITLLPRPAIPQDFVFFPSISISENSLGDSLTQWTLKFSPLSNEQASFLFSFHECSVKFKWLKSCGLPEQTALTSFAECVILE